MLLALLATQLLMVIFHAGNIALTSGILLNKTASRSMFFLRLFFAFNFVCCLWRIYLFLDLIGSKETFNAFQSTVTPFLVVAAIVPVWFLIPILKKLPSQEKLDKINADLQKSLLEKEHLLSSLEKESAELAKTQRALFQTQKMEAVGRLTGGIAHDFNNKLMAIVGSFELLYRKTTDEKELRWIEGGLEAAKSATQLSNQLLTFSQVQKIQLEKVFLPKVILDVHSLLERTITRSITCRIGRVDDVFILADPKQLELAILNLALNSKDAMPDGGALTIYTRRNGGYVEIAVNDTGSGISENAIAHIFEPFFTTKDISNGTGLGLSMVYGVAVQSGGKVFVENTSSNGTTMVVSLPVIESEETEIDLDIGDYLLTNKTIMVIDDDRLVRDALSDLVSEIGHNVIVAHDGPDGLRKLKLQKPDLMLIDYAMPGMNGAQVAEFAKEMYPDIKIGFVTGYSKSNDLEGYLVLKKPFDYKTIEKFIHKVFYK